jgi:hypothetical protein
MAPHDRPATVLARIRGWWVEKRRVSVELGLQPFSVSGTMHFPLRESLSIEELGRSLDTRVFVPVTEATVRSFYRDDWVLIWPTVFVRRAAIGYLALPAAVDGEAPDDVTHQWETLQMLPAGRVSPADDPAPGA